MARDLNTEGDIRYVVGPTGTMVSLGTRRVNYGQLPGSVDVELWENEEKVIHGQIPFDAYYQALTELAKTYKVD